MSAKPVLSKPDRKIEMSLRHTFSDKETLELARKLAEGNRDLDQAEDEKKSVTSQLKAKCDAIAARVTETAGKINCGFEYRNTSVTVKYNTPGVGTKQLVRNDTGEVFEEASMTDAERQGELKLEPVPGDPAPITANPGIVPVPADGQS